MVRSDREGLIVSSVVGVSGLVFVFLLLVFNVGGGVKVFLSLVSLVIVMD